MIQLGEHFASEDRSRHSEWLRQQRWFIKSRQDNERREDIQVKQGDDFAAFASEVIMATATQLKAFEVKLDTYDHATVAALMENQELLDAVNDRIDAMLARAHVMEDGRRVFKTEDGMQVFDEFGGEVAAEELDPAAISNDRPTWEAYSAEQETKQALTTERAQIIEFQEKLDSAREQIAEGEISETDLEALDAELLETMPDAVRAHVPDLEPRAVVPDLTAQFRAPAAIPAAQTQSAEASAPAPAPFQ